MSIVVKNILFSINSITFNQKGSLLILSTDLGYRIYDTTNFTITNKINDYQIFLLKEIKKIHILKNNTNIIFIEGTEKNIAFNNNQLIIYNDQSNKKIGCVFLKMDEKNKEENIIITFKTAKNLLFLALKNKILIFDLYSLKYIKSIKNIEINNENKKTFSICYDIKNNFIIFAYIKNNNKNNKIIIESYFSYKNKLYNKIEKEKIMNFKISKISLIYSNEKKVPFIILINDKNNTIHIYEKEINYIQLKQCIFISNFINNKINKIFYEDNFVFVLINNKIIKVYDIQKHNIDNYICKCFKQNNNNNDNNNNNNNNNDNFGCDFPINKNFSNIFCEYIIKDKFNCVCMFYYIFNNNIVVFDINGIGRILHFDENKKVINFIKNVELINDNNN